MNHYGARAQAHWRACLPQDYLRIPSRERAAFFARLGEDTGAAIGRRTEELTGQEEPAAVIGFPARYALLSTLRHAAGQDVLAQMLPPRTTPTTTRRPRPRRTSGEGKTTTGELLRRAGPNALAPAPAGQLRQAGGPGEVLHEPGRAGGRGDRGPLPGVRGTGRPRRERGDKQARLTQAMNRAAEEVHAELVTPSPGLSTAGRGVRQFCR